MTIWEQWKKAKEDYPDAIVLFVVGDFHETFLEDAFAVSNILGLTVTTRTDSKGVMPMVGFPNHLAEEYIAKLVKAGHRVVVGERVFKSKRGRK